MFISKLNHFIIFLRLYTIITYLEPTNEPTNEIYLPINVENGKESSTLFTAGIPTIM
jgi:hypothetical protein